METSTPTPAHKPTGKAANIILVVEILLWGMAILGAALKLTGQQGSILILTGLSMLSFLYMVMAPLLEAAGNKLPTNSKIAMGVVGVSFSVILMGILFRVMFWPNMFGMLLMPLFVAAIAITLFSFIKPGIVSTGVGKWALPRLALIAIPVIFFATHSTTDYYALQGRYKDDSRFMELYRDCKDNRQRCDELRAYQDSLPSTSGR